MKHRKSTQKRKIRQCIYNIAMWPIDITTVPMEMQTCNTMCIPELHVTFNDIRNI
jgi:hypothetical protein